MFKKILCATDGSPDALRAAAFASDLAKKYGAELTIMCVAPIRILDLMGSRGSLGPEGILPKQVEERLVRHCHEATRATLESLGEAAQNVHTHEIMGQPGDEICHYAMTNHFDLVVVGNRGHGRLERTLLGSVSNYVVHHCKRPVLVVNPDA